jgi:putative ABC transport system permease protein
LGLTLGLSTFLIIALFVADELSYDKYNVNADRIYRIDADILFRGTHFNERNVPAQLGFSLVKDYPNVLKAVRLANQGDILVKRGDESILEHDAIFADSTLFDLFTLNMIHGYPHTALTKPKSMVISESVARRYFNSTDVVGKTLLTDNSNVYQITGVIRDMPVASHLHLNFIRAMSEIADSRSDNWLSNNYYTYILTRPGTTEAELNRYLRQATRKYIEPYLKMLSGDDLNDLERKGGFFGYTVIPLTKIHLYSTLTNEAEPSGSIEYVYIFIVVAIFILLIACVNFMNLSTASSAGRGKEVGIRKVLGAERRSLLTQFLTESVLTSLIALVLAVSIDLLLLPHLKNMLGKDLSFNFIEHKWMLPALLLITTFVGLLAGSYPAFFLSGFEPAKVLKGTAGKGLKHSWLRDSLVVFQFTIAVMLIVGTLVVFNQLSYIRERKIGYERNEVVVIRNTASLGDHALMFKNEVERLTGVQAGTMTNNLPTDEFWDTRIVSKDGKSDSGHVVGLATWGVDPGFIPTLGIEMASGRNFTPGMKTDSEAVIINETAARLLGYRDPLKSSLYYAGQPRPIIGVVKDFNAGSLRNKIPPIVLYLSNMQMMMAFRIKSKNISSVLDQIKTTYHSINGMAGQPFLFSFMDEDFSRLYKAEQRMGKVFFYFAILTIFIACLGLFGLVSYTTELRIKEIGIRKVLGASVSGIVVLLSKDFLKLVVISLVIASPIAWLIMKKWLQGFAYRSNIDWWVFALSALLAIGITMITVSAQSFRAARSNPMESLGTKV